MHRSLVLTVRPRTITDPEQFLRALQQDKSCTKLLYPLFGQETLLGP